LEWVFAYAFSVIFESIWLFTSGINALAVYAGLRGAAFRLTGGINALAVYAGLRGAAFRLTGGINTFAVDAYFWVAT